MTEFLEPLQSANLKEVFVERFEDLILSGTLPIGSKLPPERALAGRLGVSRPVVHEGLVELATRGLVTMKPRVGTVISDYRREGSLALLASLVNHAKGDFAPPLLEGLLRLRRLVQTDGARLAATNRTDADLAELEDLVAREAAVDPANLGNVVDLDFAFHHTIALSSGNPIYPMLVKSFEPAEKNLAARFFAERSGVPTVFALHRKIVAAIAGRGAEPAVTLMTELLDHGGETLKRLLGLPDHAPQGGRPNAPSKRRRPKP